MSLLNSKFDLQSVDSPLAMAALVTVLDVNVGPVNGLLYGIVNPAANDIYGGTPGQGAAAIPPGAVVVMDASGKAVLGTAPILDTATGIVPAGPGALPVLPFITIDGNLDYSGKFVRRITCVHGGVTILTDQFDTSNGGAFTPGFPVTFVGGKIVARQQASSAPNPADGLRQIFGFVGPSGLDTINGVLQVLIPQGASY